MSPASLWQRSEGGADRHRKCVSPAVQEQGRGGATAHWRPWRPAIPALACSWVPRLVRGVPANPQLLHSWMLRGDGLSLWTQRQRSVRYLNLKEAHGVFG